MKIYILGLGSVGKSFLKILIKEGEFDPNIFYCVDANDQVKDVFKALGGKPNHFKHLEVNENNYLTLLKELEPGDYLLDFSINVKSLTILEYALNHNIHYLYTTDCSWKNDRAWISLHQHFVEYKKLREKYQYNGVTSIIEFGMNPGLISLFMKQCIQDIINLDQSIYVKLMRKRLKRLINNNLYNKAAKMLGITFIKEIDVDNQVFKVTPIKGTIYSPWNVSAFYFEQMSSPEIAYSKNKDLLKHKEYFDVDISDQYIALKEAGIKYDERVVYSKGEVTAHPICHEEIFTMREYLTDGKYRPTAVFLYHPSDLANQSILDNFTSKDIKPYLLTKKEYVNGGEEVGVLIQGKRFKSRYFANYLDSSNLDELATIKQVSAGVYGAYKYIKNHPNEGFLFPEELNEEVLLTAKKYLKDFISIEINNKVMLNNI